MSILSDLKAFLSCFILTCSIYACVEHIQVEELNLEPKFVIHSIFSPNTGFEVKVETNIEECCPVENMTESDPLIHLFEDGNNFGRMIKMENGHYKLVQDPDFIPKAGATYKLEVQSNNAAVKDAMAFSQVPENAPEFDISSFNYYSEVTGDFSRSKVRAEINFDETKPESYYHLVVESIITNYELEPGSGDTIVSSVHREEAAVNQILYGAEAVSFMDHYEGILIQTKELAHKKIVIELETSTPLNLGNQFLEAFRMELREVHKEYFNYYKKIDHAISQSSGSVPKASQIPSNIQNGLGIFSGYHAGFAVIQIR